MASYRILRGLALALAGWCYGSDSPLHAAVDLEWRAAQQAVFLGETVEIGLYALSDTAFDQSVGAVQVILIWDPLRLELVGRIEPCADDPCPPNTYNWFSAGFPPDNPGGETHLNADCSPTDFCSPYTGRPYNDGNAIFLALAKFAPNPPALATPEGLWVTSLVFRALSPGLAELSFAQRYGEAARTLVVSGESGGEVTGQLEPPAQVVVVDCPPPVVSAIGSRYLAVTPPSGDLPVGLFITGEGNPDVACLSLYVQADGRLGTSRVLRTSAEWGTVYIGDRRIVPSAAYSVQTTCGQTYGLDLLSDSRSATTWRWGDVNDSGAVNFDDLMLVVDGSQGIFQGGTILENLDLAPCLPDGTVDREDIASVEQAMGGAAFPCLPPCFPGLNLGDFAAFVPCMGGPFAGLDADCGRFDAGGDGDVDLVDYAAFQRAFGRP